ncbi:hypothetical protein RRG08_025542 [Elysia crispata]|uniref:Uncharacterized protein n=1 Tax=Elysia crispata TaxID=231223 RepID=A0AAE0YL43_9GAST|nr:hypothetical protein RRG08_025542 [Elysia crispata]
MPVGGRCDDRASHVSLCVIVAGIVLVIIGCLWPLEPAYVIDPSLTAAENEALQEDYTWRRNTLFLVSALGMACLVTGGFITSILVVRVMCHENREEDPAKLSPDWPFPPQHDMPPTESPYSSQKPAADEAGLLDADFLQAKTSSYGSTDTAAQQ